MPVDDYLIETTILVDVLRGKPEAIAWVNNLTPQSRRISVITYFELLADCRNRREQRIVTKEMQNYHLLMLAEDTSLTALSWFEHYHLSHGVGFLDSLIGATAFHHGIVVATLNDKHFDSFPALRVERPY